MQRYLARMFNENVASNWSYKVVCTMVNQRESYVAIVATGWIWEILLSN